MHIDFYLDNRPRYKGQDVSVYAHAYHKGLRAKVKTSIRTEAEIWSKEKQLLLGTDAIARSKNKYLIKLKKDLEANLVLLLTRSSNGITAEEMKQAMKILIK